jgi:hypothetical protein
VQVIPVNIRKEMILPFIEKEGEKRTDADCSDILIVSNNENGNTSRCASYY